MTYGMHKLVTRRTLLELAVAGGWSLGSLVLMPQGVRPAGTPQVPAAATASTAPETPSLPRYRFNCTTPVPAFAPLGRLEEVWASPRYMTLTGCVVSYVGVGRFALTPEESAIVDIVSEAGGDVSDRESTYLLVLTASTRIDPARLEEKLAEFGRPVITGSLALAPDAPQANLLADWLASTA